MHETNKPSHRVKQIIIFYIGFYLIGLIMAFWFGMGWFILFHTIRGFINSMPVLYLSVLQYIDPTDAKRTWHESLNSQPNQWFTSKTALVVNIVNIGLTILGFWKINIPLQSIIKLVFSK